MRHPLRFAVALSCATLCTSAAYAHYSTVEFDTTRIVEVSGTLVRFEWENPTITDPETFTAPVVLKRAWVSRPEERVSKYNCVPRDTARR